MYCTPRTLQTGRGGTEEKEPLPLPASSQLMYSKYSKQVFSLFGANKHPGVMQKNTSHHKFKLFR